MSSMAPFLLASFLAPAAAGATPALEALGLKMAAAAEQANAHRVAVSAFEVPAGFSSEAGASAADAVLRGFTRARKGRAVERENLDQVFLERRLAFSGAVAGNPLPRIAAADAVVVGSLKRSPAGWTAEVRLVSVSDARILGAASVYLDVAPEAAAVLSPRKEEAGFPPLAALRERADSLAGTTAEVLEDWLRRRDLPASRRAPAALALADAAPGSELALGEALHDSEPLVRLCAALGLGKARAAWAEAALSRVLREDVAWTPRFGAAAALGRIQSSSAAAALAVSLSSDRAWQVRQQAARSLAAGGRSSMVASALVRALQDPEPGVRAAAGAALSEWELRPEAAIDQALRREKNPSVRAAVDAALRANG